MTAADRLAAIRARLDAVFAPLPDDARMDAYYYVITTAEELDALPGRTVVCDWTGLAYQFAARAWYCVAGGQASSGALASEGDLTILALPGHPPRPERIVKRKAVAA